MRKRDERLIVLGVAGVAVLGAAALAVTALRQNAIYFYAPSELAEAPLDGRPVRIGGRVRGGSVAYDDAGGVTFVVTDCAADAPVAYHGALPDLFREGQEVVVQGVREAGVFRASEVLAKHDENYAPPEAAAALKKTGCWDDGAMKTAAG
ncbi:MAG: cytochrome c maturation protein CcmE [Pseudomonadota bacterium]